MPPAPGGSISITVLRREMADDPDGLLRRIVFIREHSFCLCLDFEHEEFYHRRESWLQGWPAITLRGAGRCWRWAATVTGSFGQ
jgi:hypothetical protein